MRAARRAFLRLLYRLNLSEEDLSERAFLPVNSEEAEKRLGFRQERVRRLWKRGWRNSSRRMSFKDFVCSIPLPPRADSDYFLVVPIPLLLAVRCVGVFNFEDLAHLDLEESESQEPYWIQRRVVTTDIELLCVMAQTPEFLDRGAALLLPNVIDTTTNRRGLIERLYSGDLRFRLVEHGLLSDLLSQAA